MSRELIWEAESVASFLSLQLRGPGPYAPGFEFSADGATYTFDEDAIKDLLFALMTHYTGGAK